MIGRHSPNIRKSLRIVVFGNKDMHNLLHIHHFTWSGGYDRFICLAKSCGLPPFPESMPAEAPCQATAGMKFYTYH